jgi:phage-related protein
MYEIEYYKNPKGNCPVKEFINSLEPKMRAKVFSRLELLEEYGSLLGMPMAKPLKDGIYELRTVQGNNITRILYFFVVGKKIILTHGFVKKTQKTPAKEIERAMKLRQDWRSRNE